MKKTVFIKGWRFEYGRKSGKSYLASLSDIIWDGFLIFMTKQQVALYQTWFARLLVAVMLLFSLVVGGLVIAAFSSALTVSLSSKDYRLSYLNHKPLAVQTHTFSEILARELGLSYLSYPTVQKMIDALLQGNVDGVIMDIPAAHYYLKHHNNLNLTTVPVILTYNEVAFAFQLSSPYVRPFNLSLTKLQDSRQAKNICKIYIGDKEAELCNL